MKKTASAAPIQVAQARDTVVVRCPFCHDGIDVGRDPWVVCQVCLARHHRSCWRESPRCATCGGGKPLEAERPKGFVRSLFEMVCVLILTVLLMYALVIGMLFAVHHSGARAEPPETPDEAESGDLDGVDTIQEFKEHLRQNQRRREGAEERTRRSPGATLAVRSRSSDS